MQNKYFPFNWVAPFLFALVIAIIILSILNRQFQFPEGNFAILIVMILFSSPIGFVISIAEANKKAKISNYFCAFLNFISFIATCYIFSEHNEFFRLLVIFFFVIVSFAIFLSWLIYIIGKPR